jgi:hypothetical protein
LRRVVLAVVLIVVAGFAAFSWSSRSLSPKTVEIAPETAKDQQIQSPSIAAATSEPSRAASIDTDPKVLIGLPVHQGTYAYRGIQVGDSQAKVLAKLKESGYATWENNGLERYTAKETPEAGISGMNVWFKHKRLEDLSFNFDAAYVDAYLNAVTTIYGPFTNHPNMGSGTETAWISRSFEPCDTIAIGDWIPNPNDPVEADAKRTGVFHLERLDSSDTGITANFCKP